MEGRQADLHRLHVLLLLVHRARKLVFVTLQFYYARLLFLFDIDYDLLKFLEAVIKIDFTLAALVRTWLVGLESL